MHTFNEFWDLLLLDGAPHVVDLGGLAYGDVDGDGRAELIVGGTGGLLWYRPETFDRGRIAEGDFLVGLTVEDVDGDGVPEVVCARSNPDRGIFWFKPTGGDPRRPWQRHAIDAVPETAGLPHDLVFADVDRDGRNELIANSMREPTGLAIYKPGDDPAKAWKRYPVQTGYFEEGLSVGELTGKGRMEIVHGPAWYTPPEGGPLAGPWRRRVYASGFREMCRTALVDVTGNGRPDIVAAESEFFDGRLSWFENRTAEDLEGPWLEHPLDRPLIYAHSLGATRDKQGRVSLFVAEMAEGGWNAPRNHDAVLLELSSTDNGKSWRRKVLYEGCGTHEAMVTVADADGPVEVVGKQWRRPKVQVYRRRTEPAPLARFRHVLLDRDKPSLATDILAADVTGAGRQDVVCGRWWYRNGDWRRFDIPGIGQAIAAYDVDGDGREELIATKPRPGAKSDYDSLTAELVWLKPVDPEAGRWDEHPIGTGAGDWPHGSLVARILPGGRAALLTAYHSANSGNEHFPELFEIPEDPAAGPWPKRTLAEIVYGEELVAADVNGNGLLDVIAGGWWLANGGDGTFATHRIFEGLYPARVRVADLTGNGRPDVIVGEEGLDFENKFTPLSLLAWFENPDDPTKPWPMHAIDKIRCPHSIDVGDLDGDGRAEIVVGEHDPFYPYRTRCRVLIYKPADPDATAWYRTTVDDRFEHHDGTQLIELGPGRPGIISHGWKDTRYVHLWEPLRP